MATTRKEDVRKLIIETTQKLLEHQNTKEVSLSKIAQEAGVSKGTIYYYFKTKEDIYFAVLDDYLKKQWEDFIVWVDNPRKDTSLPRLVKYVMERDFAAPNIRFHFFYDAMNGNEEVSEKLFKRYEDFAKLIAEKIAERTEGVSAEYLSWLLLMAADGLLLHKSARNENINPQDIINKTQIYLKDLLN